MSTEAKADITEVRITIAVKNFPTAEGCQHALQSFVQARGGRGWLCGTGEVHAVSAGAAIASVGPVLSGELVSADQKRSLRVQYLNPEQGWQVTEVEEGAGALSVFAIKETVLAIHPEMSGDRNAGQHANYVTYWPTKVNVEVKDREPCPQPGPVCVRFLGFKGGE